MTKRLPPAPHPADPETRLQWLERGTPPQWEPYCTDHPDQLRDGLMQGFWTHRKAAA